MDLFNPPINYDLTTMSEKIKLEEYTSLIFSHIKRLEDIFSNKNYNKN